MARRDRARTPAADAAGVVAQRLADGLARRDGPVRQRAAGGLRELGAATGLVGIGHEPGSPDQGV
jgi:hypothetical protein